MIYSQFKGRLIVGHHYFRKGWPKYLRGRGERNEEPFNERGVGGCEGDVQWRGCSMEVKV